jgi:hypothetical protein
MKILVSILCITWATACSLPGLVTAEKQREWVIDEYHITYSRKLGPAGPHYFQYDVYKGKKYLSYAAYLETNDSCQLLFRESDDYYIRFNLCNGSRTVLAPARVKLEKDDVDSITIRPYSALRLRSTGKYYPEPAYDAVITEGFDSTVTKKLSPSDLRKFITRFNKAGVNGYDRLGKTYHYLLTIYSGKVVRRVMTLNGYVTEDGLWSFETKDDVFFDKLWQKGN